MPDMGGIELAGKLKKIDCNIRIFFMTAFDQYALDAFGVKALGYIMKPYTKEQIRDALETAALMHSRPTKRVEIETIPNFTMRVDGRRLALGGKKQELLALLVDKGQAGLTTGEAIACLWQDRCADEKTQTLYRVPFYQLMDELMMANGQTEQLKAENQMLWVQKMNSLKSQAEETILNELIYS